MSNEKVKRSELDDVRKGAAFKDLPKEHSPSIPAIFDCMGFELVRWTEKESEP